MADKLVDIIPPKKDDDTSFKWHKPQNRSKAHSILPLLSVVLIIGLIFTTISIFDRGKLVANEVINLAKEGYLKLETAKDNALNADLASAISSFEEAQKTFEELEKLSKPFHSSVGSTELIAEAGQNLSQAGKLMGEVAIQIKDLPEKIISANLKIDLAEKPSLTNEIEAVLPQIEEISTNLAEALTKLKKINKSLIPESFEEKYQTAITSLEDITQKFDDLNSNLPAILNLLGDDIAHTYLILVQNQNELRPTGGFIGTLILAEMQEGYLTQFQTVDVYDYDGQLLNPEKIPPEFEGFVENLGIRDANYSPQFSESAKRIENLFQRANGPSADTIIAIDQQILEDLLSITGPINLQNGQITQENFSIVLTYLIEANKDENQNDKGILNQFVTDLKTKLLETKDPQALLNLAIKNARQKHIQIYSKNDQIQSLFKKFNITGEIPTKLNPDEDYLLITNSSIGGNKTDPYIDERYIHETKISKSGEVENKLTIRKYHSFTDSEELKWLNMLRPFGVETLHDPTRYVLGRGDNVSMMKVYVPFGSELLSTQGIAYQDVRTYSDPETLKTYFLFKMQVTPREIKEVTLNYRTPINLKISPAGTYKLLVQKQAGSDNVTFEKRYQLDPKVRGEKYYPTGYTFLKDGTFIYETTLTEDERMAVIVSN